MDKATMDLIDQLVPASHAGEIHFGELVVRLSEAGVESYHADYRADRVTYYAPDGSTHTLELHVPPGAVPVPFDASAVQTAIRKSQRGEIKYPEFLQLSKNAGTAGYFVWIAGRHVSYYGRHGEVHIERFPD